MSASPYRNLILGLAMAALAVVTAHGQIKLSPPDDASTGTAPAQGANTVPDAAVDAASGSDVSAKPSSDPIGGASGTDLLSQYEKGPGSGSRWLSRLKGWLGAGGAPAEQAAKAYASGDYDLALRKYAEAGLDNPESQSLAYNAGNAHYRKKKYDEAIAAYKKSLHGNDAGLASASYYNLGNAHFRKGEFAIQGGKQEGIEDYREAMAMYKKSLEIRPGNKDAKRNIEVVQARIKELMERQKQDDQQQQGNPQKPPEPSEKAKEVLARAMQLAQERRYAEAKTLLEGIIQTDATAATFQSYVQRLDDVLRILRGETPVAPQPQDPRASQPGVGVI
jgi:tetratricopeptide (TPR) repeat protein